MKDKKYKAHTRARARTHIRTHARTQLGRRASTTHTRIHARTHARTHIHTHTDTHARVRASVCFSVVSGDVPPPHPTPAPFIELVGFYIKEIRFGQSFNARDSLNFQVHPILHPEGRPGMPDVIPCLESQSCHLIPLHISSLVLLPSPLARSALFVYILLTFFFLSRNLSNIFR